MASIYDDVHDEAMADRRNADIPQDLPDLDDVALDRVRSLVTPRYLPPRPEFTDPAEPDPF